MMHAAIHYQLRLYAAGWDPDQYDLRRLGHDLRRVRMGQFATAHFEPIPAVKALLDRLGFKTIFIHRDPRDVVVSSAYFLVGRTDHFHHQRFTKILKSDDERLWHAIAGWPEDEHGPAMPSIGERLDRYRGWIIDDSVYSCRFEDLIGPRGGGDREAQLRHVQGIGSFINRPLSRQEAEVVAETAFSTTATTFRKGTIGDWRSHLTAEHKTLFKQVAGRQLIELGYEMSMDW
jgi:hypothetical protein